MTMNLKMIWTVVVGLMLIFIFAGSGFDFNYVIPNRLLRLAAIIIAAICIAFSSIIFQTLMANRILTPAIMGYEAVYLLWQSVLLLLMGTAGLVMLGIRGNFFISILLMLGYSWALHYWLLRQGKNDVYVLLLLGLVLSMVISTLSQFIQLRISPGEFTVLQGLSYASFNRVQPETLGYATVVLALVCGLGHKTLAILDVLALGREQAISLGVDHAKYMKVYLALIAILVAVSTSLIGPVAFMGVFVANIAYALAKSNRHRITLTWGCAISIAIFLVAQLLVEHVFNYKTTVTILINLVCGSYFLALVVRSRGAA